MKVGIAIEGHHSNGGANVILQLQRFSFRGSERADVLATLGAIVRSYWATEYRNLDQNDRL